MAGLLIARQQYQIINIFVVDAQSGCLYDTKALFHLWTYIVRFLFHDSICLDETHSDKFLATNLHKSILYTL